MKRIILFFFICLYCNLIMAQSYDIVGCSQGKNGAYLVKVTSQVQDVKTAKDVLRRNAVHGVMFRGFNNKVEGEPKQKPLIEDSNVERTKAEFFKTFWGEKSYERYSQMTATSLRSIKVKNGYEVTAVILVDKESLYHYLEESGIIKGLSNIW